MTDFHNGQIPEDSNYIILKKLEEGRQNRAERLDSVEGEDQVQVVSRMECSGQPQSLFLVPTKSLENT